MYVFPGKDVLIAFYSHRITHRNRSLESPMCNCFVQRFSSSHLFCGYSFREIWTILGPYPFESATWDDLRRSNHLLWYLGTDTGSPIGRAGKGMANSFSHPIGSEQLIIHCAVLGCGCQRPSIRRILELTWKWQFRWVRSKMFPSKLQKCFGKIVRRCKKMWFWGFRAYGA